MFVSPRVVKTYFQNEIEILFVGNFCNDVADTEKRLNTPRPRLRPENLSTLNLCPFLKITTHQYFWPLILWNAFCHLFLGIPPKIRQTANSLNHLHWTMSMSIQMISMSKPGTGRATQDA